MKSTQGPQVRPVPASSAPQSRLTAAPSPRPPAPPSLPPNTLSPSQFYFPGPPYHNSATSTYFTAAPAPINHQPGLQAVHPYPSGYPPVITMAPVPADATRSATVPSSSAVPMGIWSQSTSPHGGTLDGAFLATPSIPTGILPSSTMQPEVPPASRSSQLDSGFASEEDDDDDDDILTPFSPGILQPGSAQLASSRLHPSQHAHTHSTVPPESSTDPLSNTDSGQSSEVRINSDHCKVELS